MNAFHWQGHPSIFVTGKGQHDFDGTNARNSKAATGRANMPAITLPGSSPYVRPVLKDRLGRKVSATEWMGQKTDDRIATTGEPK